MARTEDTAGQGDDWAAHATHWLESLVVLIRDRSVTPIFSAVRMAVVGVLAVLVGVVVLICLVIGVVRLFDVKVFAGRVWATDLLFGGILVASGGFLLRQARPRRSDDDRN